MSSGMYKNVMNAVIKIVMKRSDTTTNSAWGVWCCGAKKETRMTDKAMYNPIREITKEGFFHCALPLKVTKLTISDKTLFA
mmetsp:Transcript_13994/g.26903  ORF Transcript_13994/g.26903 Transcript_13994/m.26903 type:complete len:81 (-) Transcript_13994:522-764(-)